MASPTNTYADYALGNDYKGATFTDGAYTAGTKTLVKAGAFAASKVNHWLYLESNDGGSIVAGYYKIATWTDANTVVLATDAGAGVDDDAAKCTQHDGTTSLPWRSVQGALDLITRDATNGDQVNVKSGTAQVNQAALTLVTYGSPAEGIPLILRGYTSAANDGGIGEIDCNGNKMWTANTYGYIAFVELEIHNFGNNVGIDMSGGAGYGMAYKCEIHKGASTPSGKALIAFIQSVVGCHVHDAGATGTGINAAQCCYGNYVYSCPTGIAAASSNTVNRNIVVDSATGITTGGDKCSIFENIVYSSTANTGTGINVAAGHSQTVIINNIIEGYSGVGGKGIAATATSDLFLVGFNAFFNNATNESVNDIYVDLGNDATLASSPFTNAAAGDFSLNTAVAGAIDGAFPGAWYGPAGTTDHADIGAVQNPAGAGGGGMLQANKRGNKL